MASQPSDWPHRSSSREPPPSAPEPVAGIVRSTSEAISTTSEDSQTVLLNHPRDDNTKADTPPSDRSNAATDATSPPPSTSQPELRHCWICLQDEGDDNQIISEWKSPCPCNLRAHEECLLEWITELEVTSSRQGQIPATKIQCPQCKAEIKIQRPREILVMLTDLIRRSGRLLVLPAGISAIIGCLYSGSMVYGFNAIHLVFGSAEAYQLLATTGASAVSSWEETWYERVVRLLRATDPFLPVVARRNWHIWFSLPFIAPGLILSRTALADHMFSILPVGYFMVQHDIRGLRHWPPSPGLTFATLPYIRSLYNELYKHSFGNLEKKWDRAVMRKPREGETAEEVAQAQEAQVGDNNFLGVDFEMEIIQEHEPEPQQLPQLDPNIQNLAQGPVVPAADAQPGVQAPQQPAAQGARPGRENEWEFRRNISTAQVMTTVMGALFFPAVSSVMGDLLKHTLPTKWVTYQSRSTFKGIQATGLLQEKWGRSVVGGCLFVVLKDALILYCKWRRAQNQGKMKVLDYVGKGKGKGRTRAS